MIVENVFEKIIYPQLKEYVEKKSIYHPQITKRFPQESKIFPIVPIKLLPVKNKYNNFLKAYTIFLIYDIIKYI